MASKSGGASGGRPSNLVARTADQRRVKAEFDRQMRAFANFTPPIAGVSLVDQERARTGKA